jgi:hypothetical protein
LNAESRSGLPALGEPGEDADDAISFAGFRIPLDGAAQESNLPAASKPRAVGVAGSVNSRIARASLSATECLMNCGDFWLGWRDRRLGSAIRKRE